MSSFKPTAAGHKHDILQRTLNREVKPEQNEVPSESFSNILVPRTTSDLPRPNLRRDGALPEFGSDASLDASSADYTSNSTMSSLRSIFYYLSARRAQAEDNERAVREVTARDSSKVLFPLSASRGSVTGTRTDRYQGDVRDDDADLTKSDDYPFTTLSKSLQMLVRVGGLEEQIEFLNKYPELLGLSGTDQSLVEEATNLYVESKAILARQCLLSLLLLRRARQFPGATVKQFLKDVGNRKSRAHEEIQKDVIKLVNVVQQHANKRSQRREPSSPLDTNFGTDFTRAKMEQVSPQLSLKPPISRKQPDESSYSKFDKDILTFPATSSQQQLEETTRSRRHFKHRLQLSSAQQIQPAINTPVKQFAGSIEQASRGRTSRPSHPLEEQVVANRASTDKHSFSAVRRGHAQEETLAMGTGPAKADYNRDYYADLGVPSTANPEEISKHFREQGMIVRRNICGGRRRLTID